MRRLFVRRIGDELGAGVVEYVGAVVVVATMAAGVVATVAPSTVGTTFMQAICKAYSTVSGQTIDCAAAGEQGGGQGPEQSPERPSEKTDADYKPDECMTSEHSQKVSSSVTIFSVKIGEDAGFVVQELNTKDGDPSNDIVRVMATDGASIGGEGGVGWSLLKDKVGASLDFGGGVKFGYGDTWEFVGQDSQGRTARQQWDAMEDDLNRYLMQQYSLTHSQGYWIYLLTCGCEVGKPKEPTYSMVEWGVEAQVEGSIGLQWPAGQPLPGEEQQFNLPGLGAGFTADGEMKVTQTVNNETGETSRTWSLAGTFDGGADLVLWGSDLKASREGAFTVTQDKEGSVTSISFATTTELGGGMHAGGSMDASDTSVTAENGQKATTSTIVTTTLDVTKLSVEDRQTVTAWVNAQVSPGLGLRIPPGAVIPSNPSTDPFESIMYENATMSRMLYDNVTDKVEFGASVKAGWMFGFDFSSEDKLATLSGAEYLGRPDGTNPRVMVPNPDCGP